MAPFDVIRCYEVLEELQLLWKQTMIKWIFTALSDQATGRNYQPAPRVHVWTQQ